MNILGTFLAGCRTRSYKKGEVILMQDDAPTRAYAIKRGIVKTYNLTSEGEEKTIDFTVANEFLLLSWLLGVTERSVFYEEAHTDCELYVFSKLQFQKLVRSSPGLAGELLEGEVKRSVWLEYRINALEQSRAQKKLLVTFQLLCQRFGKALTKPKIRIKIPFTQAELASYVGLTRETTVAELQKLKDEGVITRRAKFYTVDTILLAKYLSGRL